MGALIAIDVAIMLPRTIVDVAVSLSAALPESESQGLRLDAIRLPHITLTQQFVVAEELPETMAAVAGALKRCTPLALRITGPGRGTSSVWMRLERSPELQALHLSLMDALRPFERGGGDPDGFVGTDARSGDVRWVSEFRRRASGNRFTPHITLGHASRLPFVEPTAFDADTIALCRLGRFCTCRDVIHSWTLAVPKHPALPTNRQT